MINKDELNKALQLWIDITEIDPSTDKWNSLSSVNDELKYAQELDVTGVTVQMMLSCYVENYLENRTFNPNEMIANPQRIKTYLDKCVELKQILSSANTTIVINKFKQRVRDALSQYGGLTKEVEDVIESDDFAFIRRDALRAMNELSVHQFLQGKCDKETPKYNEYVYEFWNVNSLINCVASQNYSGVSLVMIKDEHITFAYFGFVIRNGGTITFITDRPTYPHPLAKYMSRSRGRARRLEERVFRFRFPYSLLECSYDANDDFKMQEKKSNALVVYQKKMHPIKKLIEIEPDELVWSVIMFDLIVEKFWVNKYKTPVLSYTGDMLIDNKLLIESTPVKKLAIQKYEPLKLPSIKYTDVRTDDLSKVWDCDNTYQHEWMEKRYEKEDMNNIMNLVNDDARRSIYLSKKNVFTKRETSYILQAVNPNEFGTKEEIEFNQKWAARYNKAVYIQQCACAEFNKQKDIIKQWYLTHIERNVKLHKAIAYGKFNVKSNISSNDARSRANEKINILSIYDLVYEKQHSDFYYRHWAYRQIVLNKGDRCIITGQKANIAAVFRPRCPFSLAALTGVCVDDLPIFLRHWYLAEFYSGNSILSNVDPMEWVLNNPWRDLHFDICLLLSKQGYSRLRKQYGLPANKFWNNPRKD